MICPVFSTRVFLRNACVCLLLLDTHSDRHSHTLDRWTNRGHTASAHLIRLWANSWNTQTVNWAWPRLRIVKTESRPSKKSPLPTPSLNWDLTCTHWKMFYSVVLEIPSGRSIGYYGVTGTWNHQCWTKLNVVNYYGFTRNWTNPGASFVSLLLFTTWWLHSLCCSWRSCFLRVTIRDHAF